MAVPNVAFLMENNPGPIECTILEDGNTVAKADNNALIFVPYDGVSETFSFTTSITGLSDALYLQSVSGAKITYLGSSINKADVTWESDPDFGKGVYIMYDGIKFADIPATFTLSLISPAPIQRDPYTKGMKIKQQNGTFGNLVPYGTEAKYVDTVDADGNKITLEENLQQLKAYIDNEINKIIEGSY